MVVQEVVATPGFDGCWMRISENLGPHYGNLASSTVKAGLSEILGFFEIPNWTFYVVASTGRLLFDLAD